MISNRKYHTIYYNVHCNTHRYPVYHSLTYHYDITAYSLVAGAHCVSTALLQLVHHLLKVEGRERLGEEGRGKEGKEG